MWRRGRFSSRSARTRNSSPRWSHTKMRRSTALKPLSPHQATSVHCCASSVLTRCQPVPSATDSLDTHTPPWASAKLRRPLGALALVAARRPELTRERSQEAPASREVRRCPLAVATATCRPSGEVATSVKLCAALKTTHAQDRPTSWDSHTEPGAFSARTMRPALSLTSTATKSRGIAVMSALSCTDTDASAAEALSSCAPTRPRLSPSVAIRIAAVEPRPPAAPQPSSPPPPPPPPHVAWPAKPSKSLAHEEVAGGFKRREAAAPDGAG
eukprot:scaffold133_cov257-Pinguiococcus_pyrenoidosus.AAC.8